MTNNRFKKDSMTSMRKSMQAILVHDEKKQLDLMVLPQTDYIVPVDRAVMEIFIAVAPDFSELKGERLNNLPPQTLGQIVATRKADGDVCIIQAALWRQRMAYHLGFNSKSGK